uniref:Uncharacterized protein n=1 Tax=Rhizophora mucronata TaxID=61149 RepID=A0A2P2PKV9_RHIMU
MSSLLVIIMLILWLSSHATGNRMIIVNCQKLTIFRCPFFLSFWAIGSV